MAVNLHLIACDSTSGDPIVEFQSFEADEITLEQLGLSPTRHNVTVSQHDPAWKLLAAHRNTPISDGSVPFHDLVEGIEWQIWDGTVTWEPTLVAEGITDGAVRSGARIDIRMSGGASLLRDRGLGWEITPDLMGGAGKWPTTSLTGWSVFATTSWNTTDPFQGARSLRFNGAYGYLMSPWYAVGNTRTDIERPISGRVVIRVPSAAAFAFINLRVSGSTVSGQEYARWSDPIVKGWQALEVASLAPTRATDTLIEAQVVVGYTSTSWSNVARADIGEIQIFPLDHLGATEGNRQLIEDIVRFDIMPRAQSVEAGGNLRITTTVESGTGIRDSLSWSMLEDPRVLDALGQVENRPNGPDMWFTPGRNMRIAGRTGSDRTDYMLYDGNVVYADVETDPTSRFDSLRTQTGWASGEDKAMVQTSLESPAGAIRRRTATSAPAESDFAAATNWGSTFNAYTARGQTTLHVWVERHVADLFKLGDGISVYLDVDGWRVDDMLRLGSKVWEVHEGLVRLELGYDPKVGV